MAFFTGKVICSVKLHVRSYGLGTFVGMQTGRYVRMMRVLLVRMVKCWLQAR
jgi:hypothetical protein